jgi:Domain of unknown function (DUF6456)
MIRPILVECPLSRDALAHDGLRPGQTRPSRRLARSVTVNLAESPLGWLKARGKISDQQFVAGENLRRDYECANLGPRVTMNWGAPPMDGNRRGSGAPGAATIAQITAKQRFHAAIDAAGPGLSDILWRVVCAGESVPYAEQQLSWPTRAGRLVLSLALDRVAGYYRVK